jgi:DNA-binding transcriptional LysR family regulator
MALRLASPDLTLTAMRVVDEVSARGSFTAAAGALGYTQSAVSRQVSLAEQAVGAKLFDRGSRGVRPTPRRAAAASRQDDPRAGRRGDPGAGRTRGAPERPAHYRSVPDGAHRARSTGARPGHR